MLLSRFSVREFSYLNMRARGGYIDFVRPCIGYVKQGRARFLYQGGTCYAEVGDLIYIAAGTRYQSLWTGEPHIRWYSIDFAFAEPYAYYEYPFQIVKNYPSALLDEMMEAPPLEQMSLFYRLLADLYGRMRTESRKPARIDPAVHYLEEHYAEEVPMAAMAALCGCSESTLYKKFKEVLKVSPVLYKQNLQIQRALELLSHTEMTVEEVSARVGFSSSNYFRRVFFKWVGKSPKQIKNQSRR